MVRRSHNSPDYCLPPAPFHHPFTTASCYPLVCLLPALLRCPFLLLTSPSSVACNSYLPPLLALPCAACLMPHAANMPSGRETWQDRRGGQGEHGACHLLFTQPLPANRLPLFLMHEWQTGRTRRRKGETILRHVLTRTPRIATTV